MDLLWLVAHLTKSDFRLATLTGPGGVGKSALAASAADEIAHTTHSIPVLCDLHEARTAQEARTAIAKALGSVFDVADVDEWADALSAIVASVEPGDILLILDGCEQVSGAVAEAVWELFEVTDGMRVLATSRRPLGLYGERLLPIRPLPVPSWPYHGDIVELHEYASLALFVDRVRAVDPTFALTAENADPVAEICARTDGLPLAIELVASRARLLPVVTLAERLREGEPAGSGSSLGKLARHKSLYALTETSYRLLTAEQQRLLLRIAVFSGHICLTTVESVGGMPSHLAESAVEPLVDLNLLVVQRNSNEPRFTMLETVRMFCLQQLEERGEFASALSGHAGFVRDLAEKVRPQLTGPGQALWNGVLPDVHDDLSNAVDFMHETGRHAESAATALGLHRFWLSHGDLELGSRLLEQAGTAEPGNAAELAMARGAFAVALGDVLRATESFRRAADLYHVRGDADRAGAALAQHVAAGCHAGRTVPVDYARDVIKAAGRGDIPIEVGDAALALGVSSNDLDQSADLLQVAAQIYERRKDARGTGLVQAEQAEIAAARGDSDVAEQLFRRSLEQLRSVHERTMLPTVLDGYALLLWQQAGGQQERIVRVLAGSSALRAKTNAAPLRVRRSMPGGPLRELRRALGEREFELLWAEGRQLAPDAVAAEMLSAPPLPSGHRRSAPPQHAGLTPRQLQIAELVVEGMTNRQIARHLQISEWTAVNHVRQIMRKLRLPSRIHIAQWLLTVDEGAGRPQ